MNRFPFSRGSVVWCRRVRAMTRKELLQLWRDPILLFFIAYAFTADIYLAGSGVSLELKNATTVYQDNDDSFASRELVSRFQPPHFRLEGQVTHPQEALRLLDAGRTMVALEVPPKFEETLRRGDEVGVQMQVDATHSVLGFLAYSYGSEIVGRYGLAAGLEREGFSEADLNTLPVIQNEERIWFNPNQNESWFMSLTELLNIITLFAMLLPAAAMVREKERGTIEQLLVSPLSPFQIMLPKVLSMTLVILLGTTLSLGVVLKLAFGFPFRGSLVLFFAATTLYTFTTTGIGLFLATITRNLGQAGLLALVIYTPMVFLSGAWTPPEAMPVVMRGFMYLSPLHYFLDASLGIMLKGGGLALVWHSVLGIALLGGAMFGLCLLRFRRQFK